jgi:hypothetical protein
VIVAVMTTPAWTPLFAMASAVVTDVGGPLSHGSIVAREYGIPADGHRCGYPPHPEWPDAHGERDSRNCDAGVVISE